MSTAEVKTKHTPEDLLTMPGGDRYELVDGELVEKKMGWKASLIASKLYLLIGGFLKSNTLGHAVVEGSYQCFPDKPQQVRIPDVSFVSNERLPGDLPEGHCPVAPDLAIEVVAPNDLFYEVETKVEEYLRADVRLVWVISPEVQIVHVYRSNGQVGRLEAADELAGEDVLPGFRCKVSDTFQPAG